MCPSVSGSTGSGVQDEFSNVLMSVFEEYEVSYNRVSDRMEDECFVIFRHEVFSGGEVTRDNVLRSLRLFLNEGGDEYAVFRDLYCAVVQSRC